MIDLDAFIRRLTLRPGYSLDWDPSGDSAIIYIRHKGPNARRPQQAPRVWFWSFRPTVEQASDEELLFRKLMHELVQFDLHEHCEFTLLDGVRPVDPHRDHAEARVTLGHELRTHPKRV